MRVLHDDCMVILSEVIDMPLSADALAAYIWVQGLMQRDRPVSIELIEERFGWDGEHTQHVKNELIVNGLLAPEYRGDWD